VIQAVKLGEFEWNVSVDDNESLVVVTLGHNDTADEGEPTIWFELEADAAQEMGGALIRAYGVLMRRARALPPLDTDLDDDR
jgi:lysophospholipase L1-like esterase